MTLMTEHRYLLTIFGNFKGLWEHLSSSVRLYMIGLRSSGLFGVSVIACDPNFREAPWVSILSFLMLYGRKILLQGPVSWYVGQNS